MSLTRALVELDQVSAAPGEHEQAQSWHQNDSVHHRGSQRRILAKRPEQIIAIQWSEAHIANRSQEHVGLPTQLCALLVRQYFWMLVENFTQLLSSL